MGELLSPFAFGHDRSFANNHLTGREDGVGVRWIFSHWCHRFILHHRASLGPACSIFNSSADLSDLPLPPQPDTRGLSYADIDVRYTNHISPRDFASSELSATKEVA